MGLGATLVQQLNVFLVAAYCVLQALNVFLVCRILQGLERGQGRVGLGARGATQPEGPGRRRHSQEAAQEGGWRLRCSSIGSSAWSALDKAAFKTIRPCPVFPMQCQYHCKCGRWLYSCPCSSRSRPHQQLLQALNINNANTNHRTPPCCCWCLGSGSLLWVRLLLRLGSPFAAKTWN